MNIFSEKERQTWYIVTQENCSKYMYTLFSFLTEIINLL